MAQLKSSTVTGNLAVTGAIYADKIAKPGPRVVDALQYLVGRVKNECVVETELN